MIAVNRLSTDSYGLGIKKDKLLHFFIYGNIRHFLKCVSITLNLSETAVCFGFNQQSIQIRTRPLACDQLGAMLELKVAAEVYLIMDKPAALFISPICTGH